MIKECLKGKHTLIGALIPVISFIYIYSNVHMPEDITFKTFTLIFMLSLVLMISFLTLGLSAMYGMIAKEERKNMVLSELFTYLIVAATVLIPFVTLSVVGIINQVTCYL